MLNSPFCYSCHCSSGIVCVCMYVPIYMCVCASLSSFSLSLPLLSLCQFPLTFLTGTQCVWQWQHATREFIVKGKKRWHLAHIHATTAYKDQLKPSNLVQDLRFVCTSTCRTRQAHTHTFFLCSPRTYTHICAPWHTNTKKKHTEFLGC